MKADGKTGRVRAWWAKTRATGALLVVFSLLANARASEAVESGSVQPPAVKQVARMAETHLADYITWLWHKKATPAERVAHFARLSVGRPYQANAGMIDHRVADCVTLVDQALAAGLADSWESYCRLVVRLRYADGNLPLAPGAFSLSHGRLVPHNPADEPLSLLNRNHFVIADWNRNNTWCLEDITKQLGSDPIKPWIPMHHIVRRQERFAKEGLRVEAAPEKVIDAFIPREAVPDILDELQPGDIVQVICGTWENRYCDHTGVIIHETRWQTPDDPVWIVHAAPPEVRREPLANFLRRFQFVEGFKFLRLKPDAQEAAVREAGVMASRMDVPPPATK